MKNISITSWIKNYDNGMYNNPDFNTQCEAGWYDWFCRDSSLAGKTKKLSSKVKRIAKILGKEFCDTHYVFFKNNCPMAGNLYDDFRFCNLDKDNRVVYCIVPESGHESMNGKGEVWGCGVDGGKFGRLVEGSWKDIVNYFKNIKK